MNCKKNVQKIIRNIEYTSMLNKYRRVAMYIAIEKGGCGAHRNSDSIAIEWYFCHIAMIWQPLEFFMRWDEMNGNFFSLNWIIHNENCIWIRSSNILVEVFVENLISSYCERWAKILRPRSLLFILSTNLYLGSVRFMSLFKCYTQPGEWCAY